MESLVRHRISFQVLPSHVCPFIFEYITCILFALKHCRLTWFFSLTLLMHLICCLSVKCCVFACFSAFISLSPSLCLSLTSPPLTFQHYPLLLPPDKASIVSQMLFNMESLSLCPSYRATHRAKWGYLPPFSSLHSMLCVQQCLQQNFN